MIERHPGSLVQVQDYITTRKQYFFETKLQSVTNFADVVSEVVVKTCLGLNTVAVWNVYLKIYLTIDPVSYILVTKPLNSFNPFGFEWGVFNFSSKTILPRDMNTYNIAVHYLRVKWISVDLFFFHRVLCHDIGRWLCISVPNDVTEKPF